MVTRTPSTAARIALFLLKCLFPLLFVIGFVLRVIYKAFFSWWLNPSLDRYFQKQFAEEIRQAMPRLFYEYGARVVRDPKPKGNDRNQAYVCLASGNIILKFSQWRSEYHKIRVAPRFAPADFFDVLDVVRVIDSSASADPRLVDLSWRAFGEWLVPKIPLVDSALSPERFAETRAVLTGIIANAGTQ